ncbi:MAG: hypothetical protein IKZ97_06325 [Butyrivibrio sp.]|nr:hypothetical protein [Butyrivibrio sp.]
MVRKKGVMLLTCIMMMSAVTGCSGSYSYTIGDDEAAQTVSGTFGDDDSSAALEDSSESKTYKWSFSVGDDDEEADSEASDASSDEDSAE